MLEIIITSLLITIFTIFFIFYIRKKSESNKNQTSNNNTIANKNKSSDKLSSNSKKYLSFSKPFKILPEEDHVTCILTLKNNYIISGQMNGMLSVYSPKDFKPIMLIIEHDEPITSLCELHDSSILTSSADGTMKKIRLFPENKNMQYNIEFVFCTNNQFIFKSIELSNNDILSSNLTKEFILWKINNKEYKLEKILFKEEYIRDFLQLNDNFFMTAGEALQIWNISDYTRFKRLVFDCNTNNCLYKLNNDFTAVILQTENCILLFDNINLIDFKKIYIYDFIVTFTKIVNNKILLIGEYDNHNKISYICQFLVDDLKKFEGKDEQCECLSKIEGIVKIDKKNNNWQRINCVGAINDYVIFGFGGEENKRNSGKLTLFKKNQ